MEMLTIKGKSSEDVMKIARTVDGFNVDEQYGAVLIAPKDELYVVRGTVTKTITDKRVEGIWADPKIGAPGPDINGTVSVTYTPTVESAPTDPQLGIFETQTPVPESKAEVKSDQAHTLPAKVKFDEPDAALTGCGPVTYTPKEPVPPGPGVQYDDDVHILPATGSESIPGESFQLPPAVVIDMKKLPTPDSQPGKKKLPPNPGRQPVNPPPPPEEILPPQK